MSVLWYRFCFDTPADKRFSDKEHVRDWFAQHVPDVEPMGIGYIAIPAHLLVHQGGPCWFVMVKGETSYPAFHRDVMTQLSENGWRIDGVRVVTYMKHYDENEMLFPILAAS